MNRDEILAVKDLPTAKVEVPEWGEGKAVWVRTLSGLEAESLGGDDKGNFLGRFAALVLCDEQGVQTFKADDTDEDGAMFSAEGAKMLGGKNHQALQRICDDAQKLNGIGKKAQEDTVKK